MTSPIAPEPASAPDPAAFPAPPPGCPAHAGSGALRLYGPEHAADPQATFAALRKQGSVAPVEIAPGVDADLVLGYQSALEVLRSPERFSKDPRNWRALEDGSVPADSPVVPMMGYRPNALWSDGEAHARYRGAITDSLGQVDPNALRGYVEDSADILIDRIGARGNADLLGEYGALLPLLVFNRLFGCPADIGDKLVVGMSGIFDADADSEKANQLLTEGMLELVALKRRQPGADVTSWMMAHPAGLSDEEMLHQLVLLVGAGTEPEQNLICNALLLLLSDDRFAGDLAGGSMPVDEALDEVLWGDPPLANYAVHYAIQDTEVDGVELVAGRPILVSFTAANTDPALSGERRGGNRAHLSWSAGPHTCPAKSPARLIAAVAVEKLLDRLPDIELDCEVGQLEWRQGPFHRALVALPVVFPPITISAPAAAEETSGAPAWTTQPAPPTPSATPQPPSSSTRQVGTYTVREPASANAAPRRWWSFLVGSRRGR
ncbi:cytochrome P450 [Streptomyces sp. NBC_01198]|uniref:cytochrome P450 n=1 Tax=Streptomyces sp. NBC_01198 TaxID=2903769 RepID=UPI002E1117FE|nr:cytochrome P450 [Streptomyces sp. NBC_01198]